MEWLLKKFPLTISFGQSRWLEKYINFKTKNNKAKNDFGEDFYKLLKNAFDGKTIDNVGNSCKIEIIKIDNVEKFIKQQSKLTFNVNGFQKFFTKYDCYTFKQNEVLMDEPILFRNCCIKIE